MEKVLALTILLVPQPLVGYLLWRSVRQLLDYVGVEGMPLTVAALVCAAILYTVFCFFFARGFLGSSEAERLGF